MMPERILIPRLGPLRQPTPFAHASLRQAAPVLSKHAAFYFERDAV